MKLSTKIILPIILISALLILLAGCLVTPSDEEPGYTPGTITGIIAAPCCSTSADPVAETSVSPEYWCYYCQQTWSLQDGVEVILTYGEDEIATTTTNENGEFTFTDVPPGKNYVITAYCPDYEDNRPLVKDVALEVASTFDTKITDLVSTSLGLVVDFLVLYTEWGPEDISLDEVLADRPNFYGFPKFKKLVVEVRRVLEIENCGNVDTDEDVQDALCRAAEEISGLDLGCGPGYAPGEGEGEVEDPCEGNTAPYNVSLDNLSVVVGQTYSGLVSASDDGIKDPLTYSWTTGFTPLGDMTITSAGVITWNPGCEDICDCDPRARPKVIENGCTPNVIKVSVNDGCTTVDAEFCIEVINIPPALFGAAGQVIQDMVVTFGCDYTRTLVVLDPEVTAGYQTLTFALVGNPASMSLDYSGAKPAIYWEPVCADVDGGPFNVTLEVSDGCETVSYPFSATATNDPPKLFGAAGQVIQDMVVTFGCDYSRPLVVLDKDVPDCQSLTFTLVGNPASMSMDYSGAKPAIYWEPVCADVDGGPFNVTLEVSDGCATVEYPFTATATNDLPKLFGANPQAIVDMEVVCTCTYERNLVVLDADVPDCQTITFTLKDAPPNMDIIYGGSFPKISWTPTCEEVLHGAYSVTLDVSDGCTTVSYPFDATAVNDEPEFTSLAPITLDLGNEYVYDIVVEDDDVCPEGCQTLAFALKEGPAGMTIAKTSDCEAELTWTPECDDLTWEQVCTGGDCSDQYKSVVHVKIEVDDDCCDPIYKEFDITVYSTNRAPNIYGKLPRSVCVDEEDCWTIKAYDLDNDNLTWTIVETNASGAYLNVDEGEEAELCWTANCDPITEKAKSGDPCDYDELCQRYFIVRVCDDGCPQLCDEFCFDVTVKACTLTLNLYEKDTSDWSVVDDGAEGKLIYNPCGYEFNFDFNGDGLEASTGYTLIYYPDPWPGNSLICLGNGTTDGSGNVSFAGSVDTGTDLPAAWDAPEYPGGAKIWLVLSDDVDCGNKMVGWNPEEYLFEGEVITFDDK